jgi:hypothetical protein
MFGRAQADAGPAEVSISIVLDDQPTPAQGVSADISGIMMQRPLQGAIRRLPAISYRIGDENAPKNTRGSRQTEISCAYLS